MFPSKEIRIIVYIFTVVIIGAVENVEKWQNAPFSRFYRQNLSVESLCRLINSLSTLKFLSNLDCGSLWKIVCYFSVFVDSFV